MYHLLLPCKGCDFGDNVYCCNLTMTLELHASYILNLCPSNISYQNHLTNTIFLIFIRNYPWIILIEEMAQLILIQYFKYIPMSHQNFRRRFSFTFVIRNESEKNWCKDSGTNSILFAFKNNILYIIHDATTLGEERNHFIQ